MSAERLRLYRHFPTLPDSRALLALLRMHAIGFETRYERGASYGRGGHEPDRLEVWVRAEEYEQITLLEAALTHEQAVTLTEHYVLVTLLDDELRLVAAEAAAHPAQAAATRHILLERKPYILAEPSATLSPAPKRATRAPSPLANKWLLGLLALAAAYLLVYLSLT